MLGARVAVVCGNRMASIAPAFAILSLTGAPVRPARRASYPLMDIHTYSSWTRSDGLPLDSWLRTHPRKAHPPARHRIRIPGPTAASPLLAVGGHRASAPQKPVSGGGVSPAGRLREAASCRRPGGSYGSNVRKNLLFLWAAAADLAVDGLLGTVWFTLVVTLLATGIGTIPALGVGLGILWVTARLARGIRHLERRRAEAIYGITITVPPRRRTRSTGFAGWLDQTLLDVFSGAMWKGVLHQLTTMVLGSIFWGIISTSTWLLTAIRRGALSGIGLTGPAVTIASAIVVLAAYTAGGGLLDRELSRILLGTSRAVELEERVDLLRDARRGAIDAAAAERQRIERDLHDGVQPRLVSVATTLDMARSKFTTDPAAAKALLDDAHQETKQSITELRHLARGIHPAVLTDRGLDAALSAVAQHCTVPTSVRVDLPERPSREIEAVLYFAVSEALTNASKHSRASSCSVVVTQAPRGVRAVVFDDGVGGAVGGLGGGVGLTGMADRVLAAGGALTTDSPKGGPTVLTVDIPCAFWSRRTPCCCAPESSGCSPMQATRRCPPSGPRRSSSARWPRTGRTSPSSTSGCRRPSRTRASAPRSCSDRVPGRYFPCSSSRSTSRSGTPPTSSRATPAAWVTC